jgi:hypothetical protein
VIEDPGAPSESRVLLIGALIGVGLLAAVLAVIGAFLSPWMPHLIGVPIPVGVLVAVVGNAGLGVLGARWTGSRIAPVLSALVWVVIALVLGSSRPEGDLIVTGYSRHVPGSWGGTAFLLLGTAAAAAGVAIGSGRRRGALAAHAAGPPPTPSPDALTRR